MRPTKRTKATKRERGVGDNPVVDKLMKLKYRMNKLYEQTGGDSRQKANKDRVIKQIKLVRHDVKMDASDMEKANKLWRGLDHVK